MAIEFDPRVVPRYVAVLRRAIPVESRAVDTLVHVVGNDETISEVMAWADRQCAGMAEFVSLEIVRAT